MALRTPFANDAKTYGFEWLRGLLEASLQQGVLNMGGAGTDLKATVQTGTMRIDVAAGAALIKGTSGTAALGISQGLHMVINDAAIVTAVTLDAADATNPRIDQICLKLEDSSDLGSAADQVTVVVVKGTPTSGATLDNRNGAAALPANHLRLRDQLVPAAAASLLEANGRDRRPWARGAFVRVLRTGGAYTTTSASAAAIDATNIAPRLEVSSGYLELMLAAVATHSTASWIETTFTVDSVVPNAAVRGAVYVPASGSEIGFTQRAVIDLSAASVVLAPRWRTGAATATLRASGSDALQFTAREIVAGNASN